MRLAALFYDGKSSRAQPVEVTVDSAGLTLRFDEGMDVIWPAEEIRFVESPSATTPLRLRRGFDDDARLLIEGGITSGQLNQLFPDIRRGDSLWSKNAKRLFLWGGAAVASVAFTVMVVIPLLAQQLVDNLPPSFEKRMGQQASEQIIKAVAFLEKRDAQNKLLCGAPGGEATRILNQLVGRLMPLETDAPVPVLKVVDLKMENAFALPGGHIVLFRGLLDTMQSPDELAGVLAHELGHLKYRHSTRIFAEQAGTSALIGLLFGDVTGGTILAGIGQALLKSAHTRDAEHEADAYALAVLNRENISALPSARYFERLSRTQGRLESRMSLLSSHPMSVDRAAYFRDNATGTGSALTDGDWQTVKSMCGGAKP